ncbi:hypothetical protein [Parvularcula sp. IMCC14364]|uniref:hypothetical protein n=1 Tax=Parvularcula sp. IMCC14364 TaxID=3067902 RepID=UPI002741EFBE|nr:hypothetical protein [Parvularcula sp. IMCC14364]
MPGSMEKSRDRVKELTPDRVEVAVDRRDMRRAAESPLYDFNIKRDEIPKPLASIENVYAPPEEPSCLNMKAEVALLSAVLGPDTVINADGEEENVLTLDPSGAIESAVTSLIPFNDIIRHLSGANGHKKKIAQAYFKGQMRRAYLKGWAAEHGCAIPKPTIKPPRTGETGPKS